MALLWLAVSLAPISCVLPTDHSNHHMPSADPGPPIKNLRIDARSRTLSWDVAGNVSSIECFRNSKSSRKTKTRNSCTFYVLPKCEVSQYSVNVTTVDGRSFSTWIQYPVQEGNRGAAARSLTCQVHNVDFLTCSWQAGPEAPGDVQYHLYLEDVTTEKKWQCPRYTANELGIHTQCQFNGLSGFPNVQYRFLVSGTSTNRSIPCSEFVTFLSRIEALSPPNMTVNCNKSHCVIGWKMSSHFYRKFEYNLEIQKGTDYRYTQQALSQTSFVLSSPGIYSVRIQASVVAHNISQWSAPLRIVCGQSEHADLSWLTPVVMALATLLLAGCALVLCKRYSLRQKLFPPIPDMKDPMGDNVHSEKMLAWESDRAGQEECAVAKVEVLGEK